MSLENAERVEVAKQDFINAILESKKTGQILDRIPHADYVVALRGNGVSDSEIHSHVAATRSEAEGVSAVR